MRLFIGIPLAAAMIGELSSVSARLQAKDDGLRWSAPSSWHVTLQFLGNTAPAQYDCIVARLLEVRFQPVPIRIESLGFFDHAGVFFAGVLLTPELVSLQQAVIAETSRCGFAPEERPFHPHITLARSKGKAGKRQLRALENRIHEQPKFSPFVAKEFFLYESVLGPTGSRYIVQKHFVP
jgi:RNA 2',3'-cyclic 3'-phosphodiesterase